MMKEEIIARFLEDFTRVIDEENRIAPNLGRIPRSNDSWQGFLHDAKKLKRLLNPPTLFQKADFILHSGSKSDFKIECDSLTDDDIETIAYLISKNIKFKDALGVPRGGLRLEKALEKYASDRGCHLIVDDVLTTGNSMERLKNEAYGESAIGVRGVVIFSRNICPYWITPIFQMHWIM